MFTLTKEQQKQLDDWLEQIPEQNCGAIGGRFSYQFTPTSLGVQVMVYDNLKNQKIDLTDYNDW